jgi:general secretion pathway protein G
LNVKVLPNQIFSEKGQKMRTKSGFTLVEILIVVVILGILAAIVIPQFTEASSEAKLSSLCTDLQSVRSQIELYKIQHNDALPGENNTALGGTHTGTSGFVNALIDYTDIDGVTTTSSDPNGYGPYLQKVPTNQFNDKNNIESGTGTPGGNDYGWYFNTDTGAFHADTDLHTSL